MQKRTDDYMELKNSIIAEAKAFMTESEVNTLGQVLDKTIDEMGVSVFKVANCR